MKTLSMQVLSRSPQLRNIFNSKRAPACDTCSMLATLKPLMLILSVPTAKQNNSNTNCSIAFHVAIGVYQHICHSFPRFQWRLCGRYYFMLRGTAHKIYHTVAFSLAVINSFGDVWINIRRSDTAFWWTTCHCHHTQSNSEKRKCQQQCPVCVNCLVHL